MLELVIRNVPITSGAQMGNLLGGRNDEDEEEAAEQKALERWRPEVSGQTVTVKKRLQTQHSHEDLAGSHGEGDNMSAASSVSQMEEEQEVVEEELEEDDQEEEEERSLNKREAPNQVEAPRVMMMSLMRKLRQLRSAMKRASERRSLYAWNLSPCSLWTNPWARH